MAATIFYNDDADLAPVQGRTVAIIGYGSQGHAHALNLRDSGVKVIVGLAEGSKSRAKAEAEGLRVATVAEAAAEADLIMILTPDQVQAQVYKESIEPNLEPGDALFFAHGFNIHFGYITVPEGVDVAMVAPKGPGHTVRREYEAGRGVPALVAVEKDPSGKALDLALSYAKALGATRQVLLRPLSPKKPSLTSLVSRRCCAVRFHSWFSTVSRFLPRQGTSLKLHTSRFCTNSSSLWI